MTAQWEKLIMALSRNTRRCDLEADVKETGRARDNWRVWLRTGMPEGKPNHVGDLNGPGGVTKASIDCRDMSIYIAANRYKEYAVVSRPHDRRS